MKKKNNIRTVSQKDIYVSQSIFFAVAFVFFCFIANYILFFQETQFLFVFSGDYLHEHLLKPGALLEYAARFLSQFYHSRFSGSLIVSVILTLPGIITYIINRRLIPGISFSLVLLLLPSCLLLLLQANYYHLMEYNLGFLLVLLYYLFSISSGKKIIQGLVIIMFPLFYYLAGAYALIFALMYIVHNLIFNNSIQKYVYSIVLLLIAVITILLSREVVFLQPVNNLIFYPFPLLENPAYRAVIIILTGYIVLYPLVCRIARKFGESRLNLRLYSLISAISVFGIIIFLVIKTFNPQTARVVQLERLIFDEKWEEAIRLQEKKPATNLIGEYFYNFALSETGQLCDRLFYGPQDFLAGSLVLPWGDVHLDRGAYFYYAIGLMNEAHRWAYEEMVVYGYRPQNIRMLAKTSLINGDNIMAKKYLNILKKTIYYRKWAKEFEKLADNPDLIRTHPELGEKLKILPKNNFFIQFNEPQNNLAFILEGQPDNRKAIEYYLAGLLLTKKVELAVNNVKNMKSSGYTRIPRYIEEAVMIYYNSQGVLPDLGGLTITPETQTRFSQYFSSYMGARQNPALLKEKMQEKFGNTFWYYFHFK
jgi:hypothetical protein